MGKVYLSQLVGRMVYFSIFALNLRTRGSTPVDNQASSKIHGDLKIVRELPHSLIEGENSKQKSCGWSYGLLKIKSDENWVLISLQPGYMCHLSAGFSRTWKTWIPLSLIEGHNCIQEPVVYITIWRRRTPKEKGHFSPCSMVWELFLLVPIPSASLPDILYSSICVCFQYGISYGQ